VFNSEKVFSFGLGGPWYSAQWPPSCSPLIAVRGDGGKRWGFIQLSMGMFQTD